MDGFFFKTCSGSWPISATEWDKLNTGTTFDPTPFSDAVGATAYYIADGKPAYHFINAEI